MRYVLLDRVTELVPGVHARGIKCVTLTDEVLHDHFPGYPVLPGVLLVESAAQLAGFLLEMTENREGEEPRRAVMVQIDKVKFHEPTVPGDAVELLARLKGSLEGAARLEVEAAVRGALVMRGTLTFMLKRVDAEEVHAQRRALYRVWTRQLGRDITIV